VSAISLTGILTGILIGADVPVTGPVGGPSVRFRDSPAVSPHARA
jgi:hypothetical protein